jgi:hypothetical protein
MKVLLLHPEDTFDRFHAAQSWDRVVDLGRAPLDAYKRWERRTGCPVVSIQEYAEGTADLHRIRKLLQFGAGRVVDQFGIDWWDIFSLEIASGLLRIMLVHRLAWELPPNCDLYSTRPDPAATALQRLLDARLTYLGGSKLQSMGRQVRRYYEAFSRLDNAALLQLFEDKFDIDHSLRRRFAARVACEGQPAVLLPSAYVNVSRTVLSYAALLPHQQFVLVVVRRSGYPVTVPPNVRVVPLTPYFGAINKHELVALTESWDNLKTWLAGCAPEFQTAESEGMLGPASAPFAWGLAVRDAWLHFFASQNVTACLSADDSNFSTRIPLILARKKGVAALACHHGALDFRMAIKVNHADFYLAKSEMERDYLRHVCHLAPEQIVVAAPASPTSSSLRPAARRSAPWMVFFSEPYQCFGWHRDEVYGDLLPRLWSLAQTCGLKLVFKLHPFENVNETRHTLRHYLPEHQRHIEVIAGPPSDELWNNTRFALTVQSSAALDCTALGIPVFLCSWLQDSCAGYVQGYAKFGVGCLLRSPDQIAEIPRLLEKPGGTSLNPQASRSAPDPDGLAHLLSGAYAMPMASVG